MGLDLKLIVCEGRDRMIGRTVLQLDQDYQLFDRIKAQEPQRVPPIVDISTYFAGRVPDGSHKDEACYGDLRDDPYGEPITWLETFRLRRAFTGFADELSQINKAVSAFLSVLPDKTMIALYWH